MSNSTASTTADTWFKAIALSYGNSFASVALGVSVGVSHQPWCPVKSPKSIYTDSQGMEPTEAQYLIINVLETLELLGSNFCDEDTSDWYIQSPSPVLPNSIFQQNGDLVPIKWRSEL